MGRALHLARVGLFYVLTALFTLFLTLELFAHLLLPTPVMTQWAAPHHIHALCHLVLTAILIAAVGTGLHPRLRRIAGLQGLLLVVSLGLLATVIAWQGFHPDQAFPTFNFTLYGVVALLLALLHPERGRLLARGDWDRGLAAMAVVAFVPAIAYAALEVAKQQSGTDPVHSGAGHFALMASLAVVLAALAGLAALRTEGWRLPLWSAGLAVVALGLGSIAFPTEASSLGLMSGLVAVVWGVAFIAFGHRGHRAALSPALFHSSRPTDRSGR